MRRRRSAQWRRCRRSTPTVTSCRCRPGIAFRAPSTGCCASASPGSPTSSAPRRSRSATRDLALAHDPAYVAAVHGGDARRRRAARDRLPVERGDGRALASLGRRDRSPPRARALAEGVAANLAGGTHHASPTRGSGYCVFNDVAVAVAAAAGRGRAARGSSSSTSTSTRATARRRSSPATRACSRSRCTARRTSRSGRPRATSTSRLPDGCGDADYLGALEHALDVLGEEHGARPFGLAFYLAGADPHEGDRLGRLKLSAAGLLARDRRVLALLGALRHPGRAGDGRRLRPRPRRHRRDPGGDDRGGDRRLARVARSLAQRRSGGEGAFCATGACRRQSRPMTAAADPDPCAPTATSTSSSPRAGSLPTPGGGEGRPPRAGAALALPPLRPAGDALDRQRRLRPPQQRRLPEPVRQRRQRRARRRRRARHRARRGDRPGGRDAAATSSRRSPSRRRSRPASRSRASAARACRYEIGIFAAGAAETAAHGRFVHVYVDRATRRPVPLPDRLLAFVKALQ